MRWWLLFFPLSLHAAFELIVIQGTSPEAREFLTRQNLNQGSAFSFQKEGVFTFKNTSVVAKVVEANNGLVRWRLASEKSQGLPFSKGDAVTYQDAKEYVWGLTSGGYETMKSYAELQEEKILKQRKNAFRLRTGLVSAITASVSGIDSFEETSRGGFQVDALYSQVLGEQSSLDFGLRYGKETIVQLNGDLDTNRILGLAVFNYYIPWEWLFSSEIFLGTMAGLGRSETQGARTTQSGTLFLLPGAHLGLQFPLLKGSSFQIEAALENLRTEETASSGPTQTTNQTNFVAQIGLRFAL